MKLIISLQAYAFNEGGDGQKDFNSDDMLLESIEYDLPVVIIADSSDDHPEGWFEAEIVGDLESGEIEGGTARCKMPKHQVKLLDALREYLEEEIPATVYESMMEQFQKHLNSNYNPRRSKRRED